MRPEESLLNQPLRSLQTMLRVLAEDDSSLPTVVPDGIYGQDTITAVSAFQRKYALPVTGVTDQATWDQIVGKHKSAIVRVDAAEPIEIILEPGAVFRLGDRSPYIYLAQSMLTILALEHDNLEQPPHTGTIDSGTSEALAAFQLLAGLKPTGELDRNTWKFLSRQFTLAANRQSRFK